MTGVAREVVCLDDVNLETCLDTGKSFCSYASGMVFCNFLSDSAPSSLKFLSTMSGAFFMFDYLSSSIHGPLLGD